MKQNQKTQNHPKKDAGSQRQTQGGRSKETDPNNPIARTGNKDDSRQERKQQQNEDVTQRKPHSKDVFTEEMDEEEDDR